MPVEIMKPKKMVWGEDFLVGDIDKDPPVCPDGWERAEDNPYVLLRKLPACSARGRITTRKACCGEQKRIVCGKTRIIVTRKDCLDCIQPG